MTLAPRLTAAAAPLMHEVAVLDEFGAARRISIPAERALTVFVDRRELVTLMTLGAAPELLVLGYLRNQRLVDSVADIHSITVDWDVQAAAVKTRAGIEDFDRKTAKRVVRNLNARRWYTSMRCIHSRSSYRGHAMTPRIWCPIRSCAPWSAGSNTTLAPTFARGSSQFCITSS